MSSDGLELYHFDDIGRFCGEHSLLRRSCPVTYIAITRCEFYVMSCKTLANLATQYLNELERESLAKAVVHEWCRKAQLKYFAMRMHLGNMANRCVRSHACSRESHVCGTWDKAK